jgi:hypothetical protein
MAAMENPFFVLATVWGKTLEKEKRQRCFVWLTANAKKVRAVAAARGGGEW